MAKEKKDCICKDHSARWKDKGWVCDNCKKWYECDIGGIVICCPLAPHRPPYKDEK